MAVVRCPHCNKPNPDFLDLCQYCDQPLRPGDAPAAPTPAPESNAAASAWDELEGTPSSMPDPEPADAESDAPADVPSWVSALAEGDEPAQSEAPGLPDWFSSLTTEDTTMIAAPATRLPIDEEDTPVTSGQAAPDWFTDPEAADAPVDAPAPALPDWLSALSSDAPGGEYDAPKPEKPALPEWFDEPVAAEPASAEPAAEEPTLTAGDALPDWLTEMTPDEPVVKPSTQPIQPTTPAPQPPLPPAEVPAELGSETPDWLNELASGPVALTMAFDDDDPVQPPSATPAPADDGDDLPPESAWSPADDEAPTSDDLSQAEIPAWLSAMRPTDVQGAPDDDDLPPDTSTHSVPRDGYEEAIGVLAGMRGVLRAEPSVVLPGKAASNIHTLTVTESQNKAAQVLAALARAEVGTATPRKKARFRLPLLRWLVAAVLMLAAVTPYLAPGLLSGPAPLTVGSETALAAQAIEDLGRADVPKRPVLLVVDYEPGQAAELNPAAEAFARHALRLGLPVVAVSTTPSSAGVAEQVIQRSAQTMSATSAFTYEPYTHFVNLGYLPGGGVGVVEFANAPRNTFLSDFSGQGTGLWEQPALASIHTLADFGALLIVSGSPEGARAWLEQTALFFPPERTIVIGASAGAGPLLRPYLVNHGGSVDGMVSGLSAAAQYEAQAGLTGDATTRWSLTGGVLLAAAAIIVIGNLLAGLSRLRIRR